MKIVEVNSVQSWYVETDEGEWPTYRRNSKDSWEQLMGNSFEEVCHREDIDELEKLFNEFNKKGEQ